MEHILRLPSKCLTSQIHLGSWLHPCAVLGPYSALTAQSFSMHSSLPTIWKTAFYSWGVSQCPLISSAASPRPPGSHSDNREQLASFSLSKSVSSMIPPPSPTTNMDTIALSLVIFLSHDFVLLTPPSHGSDTLTESGEGATSASYT